jgi:putative SOS response-associated peptidase YedK
MCGRFANTKELQRLISRFKFVVDDETQIPPRFNIAPSQDVPVIIEKEQTRHLKFMRWGLVPFWADDPKIGFKMINARSDKVAISGAFKHSLKRRRCLIPADGFYEWEKRGREKIPHLFRIKGGELFAFAGLWDRWEMKENINSNIDKVVLHTFTIITTDANNLVSSVHDRMPVILTADNEEDWLNTEFSDFDKLLQMLSPYPEEKMEMFEVSKIVNSPSNDTQECIRPTQSPQQGELF